MSYQQQYYQANRERIRATRRQWAKDNPQKVKEWKRTKPSPEAAKRRRDRWEARNPTYILWNAAKQRAKRDGLEFSLDRGDIVIPETCPLLGMPIKRGRRGDDQCPSLDRIDNSLGYVPGNVWVISWLANKMKATATKEQLDAFAVNWLKRRRESR